MGAKKQASYRIVVAESTAPRDGKAIAILGHYNPLTDPYTLKVDEERAVRWLQNGAQPSETARGLLAKAGVLTAYEAVRKGSSQPKKAEGSAVEETKARRAARGKRTEPARLVRPPRKEGAAAEAEELVGAAAAKKPAAKASARAKTPARAAAKPAAKAKTAAAPKKAAAPRAAKPKAAAAKKS